MHRFCIASVLFLSFALFCPLAYADKGLISVSPEISVYEPGQKAIIAWNGQEEFLILSTDVNSTQQTIVLEILPLPSKPVVEEATFQSFQTLQAMVRQEGISRFAYSTNKGAQLSSVEVLFNRLIGAHNITVVKASDASEFMNWTGAFLTDNGLNERLSLGEFDAVIEDYIDGGFRYFALDLVTFYPEERSVDAILYRFDSSFLYYPLLITSPVSGNSEITLFLLTEEKIDRDYWPMQKALYRVSGEASQPIEFVLSKGDLSMIDSRIAGLFQDEAWLTVLRYEGELNSLTKDLMISEDALAPSINVEATLPTDMILLSFLLGAVSTLAGALTTYLIIRKKKP